MLIASLIFVLSFAALVQFAALSWRAGLLRVATAPLEFESDLLANMADKSLSINNFRDVCAYQKLCPNLVAASASGPSMGSVGLYYRALQAASLLGDSVANWARGEMDTCARFAAVALSQQLARTQVLAAELGSY